MNRNFVYKFFLVIAFLVGSMGAFAQTSTIQGWCQTGGAKVTTSGLNSTTTVQQSYPKCTVTVYLHGTTNLATIYKDGINTPLSNPFTANTDGSWLLYAANGFSVDVVMSGGTSPNVFAAPFTLTNLFPGAVIPTSLSGGVAGSIPYQSAPSTTTFLAPNTLATPTFLAQSNSVPFWSNSFIVQDPTLNTPGTWPFGGSLANGYFSHYIFQDQATLPVTDSIEGANALINFTYFPYSGGYNFAENGYVNKTFRPALDVYNYSMTPGETNGIQATADCFSSGDCFPIAQGGIDFGGHPNGSDEGAKAIQAAMAQGYIEYQGTCNTGCSANSTTITVTPTQGQNTQGARRWLVDTSKAFGSGTITTISGSGPTIYTGSGTGWAVSTETALTTSITIPSNSFPPVTVTATVGSTSGMSTSTLLCIADSGTFEMVYPSAINSGNQFTATFQKAHQSGAIVAFGGLCGNYVALSADTVTSGSGAYTTVVPPLRQMWPVIGTTSATSMQVWINVAAHYDNYSGQAKTSAGTNTYTLFPGAEILSANVTCTGNVCTPNNQFTLAANNVNWTNGDSLSDPLYPASIFNGAVIQVAQWFAPQGGASGGGLTLLMNGIWAGNNDGIGITNNTPTNVYTATFQPPKSLLYGAGYWNRGLLLDTFPANSLIQAGCPLAGCSTNAEFSVLNIGSGVGSGSDQLVYNPSIGQWHLFGAGHAQQWFWLANGQYYTPSLRVAIGNGEFDSTISVTGLSTLTGGATIGGGATISNSNAVPQVGTPTVGQAACIKSAGPPVVIGFCSTVVSAGGACTCN